MTASDSPADRLGAAGSEQAGAAWLPPGAPVPVASGTA